MDAREPVTSAGSAPAPITLPSNLIRVTDDLAVAIVPGTPPRNHPHCIPLDPPGKGRRWTCKACGAIEHGIPQGHCSAPDREPCSWCGWINVCAPDCPGVSIALGMADQVIGGDVHPAVADYERRPQPLVAPQEWAQYDKPCERCNGNGGWLRKNPSHFTKCGSPDCRDGRQLWTVRLPCPKYGSGCDFPHPDRERRATLQVVPVVRYRDWDGMSGIPILLIVNESEVRLWTDRLSDPLPLDPLPVVSRDFGLVVKVTS